MTALDPAERERKRRRHRLERIVAAILILIAAAAVAGGFIWKRAEEKAIRSDLTYIPGPVTITPEVTSLQELVRIDSSKPEGVAAGAKWIAAYLERNGIRAELIESKPSMVSVYARIEGRAPGGGLLLFSHIDVVPPGPGWTSPPFGAGIGGDRMWGRGTLDMKALIICQLVAFVAVAKSGDAPAHDLVFLATPDEETGSQWGMQWLLANRPDVFADVRYGITEGGITEMTGSTLTYFGIETGGKQIVYSIIEARTREALAAARIALEPHMFPRMPERVTPEVRTYFAQIAPTRMQYREHLTDIDATIRNGKFWELPITYRDLVQNSLHTGPPEQKDGRWTMLVTMANLPDEQPDARLAWLARTIAPHATIRAVPRKEGPVPVSTEKTELFELIRKRVRERYHVASGVLINYRSATDSRFLRKRGIVCYGLSPYPVSFFQSLAIHQEDESITVGSFQDGVELLRDVVTDWSESD